MFDTKLVEITDYGFAAITRLKVDDALLAETEKLGWRLVIGDATEFQGLASAYQRVTSLRARVQATGKSARVDEVTWSVAGLLGREAGTMLAARLLEPVLSQEDPERRSAQLAVLRTWLGENGSWDATAKALGLHRNSVRRQINALAELLDTDLNQAQVRAELWFALQYVDELRPPAAGEPVAAVFPVTVEVRPALPEVRHGVPRFPGGRCGDLGEQQFRPTPRPRPAGSRRDRRSRCRPGTRSRPPCPSGWRRPRSAGSPAPARAAGPAGRNRTPATGPWEPGAVRRRGLRRHARPPGNSTS